MTRKAPVELLEELHGEVARTMIQWVQEDEVDEKRMRLAVQFLKDNNITADLSRDPVVKPLTDFLPDIADLEDVDLVGVALQ